MKEKNWSTLQKDDILYLYLPISNGADGIFYIKQESSVISIKLYEDLVTYIRFKYTDFRGKRHRLDLGINKTKYNWKVVSTDKTTEYAHEFPIKFGDFLVSYISFEEIENELKLCKKIRIKELQDKIESINNEINILKNEI